MYKTGERTRQNFSSSSGANEKLKQKKRLSFREPEVETSHNSSWSNTNRIQSKQHALLAPSVDRPKKSTSLEDLTLEDQTFIIAKYVGQAFDKRPSERRQLSSASVSKTICSDSRNVRRNSCFLSETLQNDCSHIENRLQKNGSNTRAALSSEDAQYFESLSPPVMNTSAMKFPALEMNECSNGKSNQALVASVDMASTSVQHQMQFLKYQLEQQRQQTEAALSHIQLLKDQLQAETSARYKAQTQNHQLIMQNKELLDHIQNLFRQIQDLEKLLLEKHERKPTFPSSTLQGSQEIQITGATTANAFTEQTNNGYHQTKTSAFETTAGNTSSVQKSNSGSYPVKTSSFMETNVAKTISAQNNNGSHQAKPSAYAPNTTMTNRRNSLTNLKPFQSKTNYLELNSKHDEDRTNSKDSSPVPTRPISKSQPFQESQINNSNTGRSFLFKTTQKYYNNNDNSTKDRNDDVKDHSSKDATKISEKPQVSSVPVYNRTTKHITATHSKSSINNEIHIRGENVVLNENPFFIEEKRPGKLEGYATRKNHSSDLALDESSSKISSVALSPKSYSTLSKSSKVHKNDSTLPLAFENTSDLCIKENQRFSSGTSRLFNS